MLALTMVAVHRFRSLGQFLLLDDPERPIAVIPRLGDSSLKAPKAAEAVIRMATSYRQHFYRIWLIFPEDSLLTQEVLAQAKDIDALDKWLFLAIPDDESLKLVHYKNLRRVLEKRMFGEDEFSWEGVAIHDGRPMSGRLPPLKN